MEKHFTLEYWIDDKWYVGRLKEAPGVFSQGATMAELEENVKDAYKLILEDNASDKYPNIREKDIVVDVA